MIPFPVRPLVTSFGAPGDNDSVNGPVSREIEQSCYRDQDTRAEDDEDAEAAHELSVSETMIPVKSDLEG